MYYPPKENFVLLHLDIIDDRNKLMTQTMINLILSSNYFMFSSDAYLKACSLVCVFSKGQSRSLKQMSLPSTFSYRYFKEEKFMSMGQNLKHIMLGQLSDGNMELRRDFQETF